MWFIKIHRSIFYELFTLAKKLLSDGTPEWSAAGLLASLFCMNVISIAMVLHMYKNMELPNRNEMAVIFLISAFIHYWMFIKKEKYKMIVTETMETSLVSKSISKFVTVFYVVVSFCFFFTMILL
jgi:hypothetical protein